MTQFLDGIGYNGWILPALLVLPALGALLLVLQGALQQQDAAGAMRSSRALALGIAGSQRRRRASASRPNTTRSARAIASPAPVTMLTTRAVAPSDANNGP